MDNKDDWMEKGYYKGSAIIFNMEKIFHPLLHIRFYRFVLHLFHRLMWKLKGFDSKETKGGNDLSEWKYIESENIDVHDEKAGTCKTYNKKDYFENGSNAKEVIDEQ